MDDQTRDAAPVETAIETEVDTMIDSVLFSLPDFVKQLEMLDDDHVLKEPKEFTYGVALGMIASMVAAKIVEGADTAKDPTRIYAVLSERIPKMRKAIFD